MDIEFLIDTFDMELHGVLRHHQLFGHSSIRLAARDKSKHLAFAFTRPKKANDGF